MQKGKGDIMEITMEMSMLKNKSIEKAEFDRIMEEHAKWLADMNTGKKADLSDLSLTKMDLSGLDLSYANMEGTSFVISLEPFSILNLILSISIVILLQSSLICRNSLLISSIVFF